MSEVKEAVDKLEKLEVKGNNDTAKPPANQKIKSRDYSTTKYTPKTPLGMKDYKPEEMAVREKVFNLIKDVFKSHGAVSIETPVAELKATLTGKYGEDSKLIYDLADQGGEILALRYDLTVPFARFCAQHNIKNIKRYHIARVYRRDRPVMSKGRYREFYQCDIDIAGEYESMVPDAECVKIVSEILTKCNLGDFKVKVNHRKILDGIFSVCGVPEELFRPICSAVDKLDKMDWEDVKKEMVQKGISEECADMIGGYVSNKGGKDIVQRLLADNKLCANEMAKTGLEEMEKLFEYCEAMNVPADHMSFDISLARGLDYYTGVIYEAVLVGKQVGSVAGGGRYDGLVGMFKKKNKTIPCVGVSIGIERLFAIVAQNQKKEEMRTSEVDVFVCSVAPGKNDRKPMLIERLKLQSMLWAAGIKCDTIQKMNPKILSQFQHCEAEKIPFAIVIGPDEVANGEVKIRTIATQTDEICKREDAVSILRKLLANNV